MVIDWISVTLFENPVGSVALLAAFLLGVISFRIRGSRTSPACVTAIERDLVEIGNTLDRFESEDWQFTLPEVMTQPGHGLANAIDRLCRKASSRIAELETASLHDPLTGLLNAASFKLRCIAALSRESSDGSVGCMIFLDLDNFKNINDSLGHAVGDRFLVTCADRLRLAVDSVWEGRVGALVEDSSLGDCEALIGRMGGDEFAIFLPLVEDTVVIDRFIQRVQAIISESCHVGHQAIASGCSIGATLASMHHGSYERTLAAADTAMYEAKAQGRGTHCIYRRELKAKADGLADRQNELREAIAQGQFFLVFQPQLGVSSHSIRDVEALVRWQHPLRGVVPPADFVPFAERYGLINEIGSWVIREAIKQAAEWREQGRDLRVSVNVSPNQLNRIDLIPSIRACLKKYGLPGHALEIEVTEAAVMQNDWMALERLEGLRKDGIRIALDDFGTGYSNLAQLLALPIDRLKLDRSLVVAAEDRSSRAGVVITSLVTLANALGFRVVAEGIETETQNELVRRTRCHFIQGYLVSPPLRADDLLVFVDQFNAETGRSGKAA